ncbi:MAG: hypothetical protein KGO93_08925 [Cyanobacteria bacterium REEB446]|nr:hypothetical protein [Cyanobacteria bacterium REEB446]
MACLGAWYSLLSYLTLLFYHFLGPISSGHYTWYEINFKGYTSNCLIPGFTEGFCSSKDGYSFDTAYLAKEKRSGYFANAEKLFTDFREPKIMSATDHQAITDFLKIKI